MRALIVFLILLLAGPAWADLVARSGANELRLSQANCDNPAVLAAVGPTLGAKMRAATARVEGEIYAACWVLYQGNVYVIYEDGDQSAIPLSAFKAALEV